MKVSTNVWCSLYHVAIGTMKPKRFFRNGKNVHPDLPFA
ncbi:hypothetical protein B4064_1205 [Caldibacillus thermoamylovorans]|nr:hypothetical protein B4065_2501 [Caldibacillus thermoamylovorans]KIO69591.1 hypothetical protein B4064_1205 [Caldibacillus thermoamylovorans]